VFQELRKDIGLQRVEHGCVTEESRDVEQHVFLKHRNSSGCVCNKAMYFDSVSTRRSIIRRQGGGAMSPAYTHGRRCPSMERIDVRYDQIALSSGRKVPLQAAEVRVRNSSAKRPISAAISSAEEPHPRLVQAARSLPPTAIATESCTMTMPPSLDRRESSGASDGVPDTSTPIARCFWPEASD
jgi:hypothetical protein